MLRSGLSSLSDRVDAKFLTAYWLPAFVAVFGGLAIVIVFAGPDQVDFWVNNLDSVQQTIGAVVLLLTITMWAFVLRALTQPIVEFFAGAAMPRALAGWSLRGQRRARQAAERVLGVEPPDARNTTHLQPATMRFGQLFPQDEADMQPTLFGNVLAAAGEHPRFAYAMEGALWWPRLSPLLPSYFQDTLGGAQAPLMALLNLSVVFSAIGVLGVATLGPVGGNWLAAFVFLIGGALVSHLCYRAAVSQAVAFATLLRVAFDLYRHEILKQMDEDVPSDLAAERALWERLTPLLLDIPDPASSSNDVDVPPSPSEGAASAPPASRSAAE
jgi:hypothetical protein